MRRSMILFALLGACVTTAHAQQTIFNVPSPDVLASGSGYVETDQYLRWDSDSDDAAFFLLRGVGGVGSNVEVGLNSGPFDYLNSSNPFIDAAVKWRPVMKELGSGEDKGAYGFFVGDNLGVQVHGDDSGTVHDYAYAAGFVTLPSSRTRFSAGPYYVTDNFFGPEARFGAQVTVEQPIASVKGLVLAADWFSGTGGYATPSMIWTLDRFVVYAGYGFSNDGRDNDLLTLEFGFNF